MGKQRGQSSSREYKEKRQTGRQSSSRKYKERAEKEDRAEAGNIKKGRTRGQSSSREYKEKGNKRTKQQQGI